MAFTTYRTWVASETLTAALLNSQIRDNGNLTPAALATTKGDTFVATAANAVTRLGVGSDGSILVADSAAAGGVRWSSTGKTAAGGFAIGFNIDTTLTMAANNDTSYFSFMDGTVASGTYTGLTSILLAAAGGGMAKTGTGTIDNAYAVYITPPTIGTDNWPLYVTAGNVRLGDGITYINDTSNANMTRGLTINQGAADNSIVALKSSDVAHGITDRQETDTYAYFYKQSNSFGGLGVNGVTGSTVGVELYAYSTTEDSTRSTAAVGAISLRGATKSGTDVTGMAANKNILVVGNASATCFILDTDGDSHEDGTGWTAYDDWDDAALLDTVNTVMVRAQDPIRRNFWKWVKDYREPIEKAKLITFNKDGHHFINRSKMQELLVGAVRQQAQKYAALTERLTTLETRLLKAGV